MKKEIEKKGEASVVLNFEPQICDDLFFSDEIEESLASKFLHDITAMTIALASGVAKLFNVSRECFELYQWFYSEFQKTDLVKIVIIPNSA